VIHPHNDAVGVAKPIVIAHTYAIACMSSPLVYPVPHKKQLGSDPDTRCRTRYRLLHRLRLGLALRIPFRLKWLYP
jgi:hypothetical protein